MKRTRAVLCVIILVWYFIVPPFALAATPHGSVGIYTKAAVGDPSLAMISHIVGGVTGVFPGEDTPLTKMFMVFNVAVLTISLTFAMWNFGSGAVQTAHEGEFLGKRFSSIWMPIRNTVGVGGLIPAFGGWSACQIVMLWAVTIGIGLGNLTYQAGYKAMIGHIRHPVLTPRAVFNDKAMLSIIQAQTCMIGFNEELDKGASQGLFKNDPRFRQHGPAHTPALWNSKNLAALNFYTTKDGISMFWGGQGVGDYPIDICGGVRIPAQSVDSEVKGNKHFFSVTESAKPVVDADMINSAYMVGLGNMARQLLPISKGIVHGHYPTAQQMINVKEQFLSTFGKAISSAVLSVNSSFANFMKGQEGRSWIYFGSLFSRIADINKEVQNAANVNIVSIPINKIIETSAPDIIDYGGAKDGIAAFQHWRDTSPGVVTAKGPHGGNAGAEKFSLTNPDFSALLSPFRSTVVDGALYMLTRGDSDLFTSLINVGNTIMTVSAVALAKSLGIIGVAEGISFGTLSGTATVLGLIATSIGIFFIVLGVFLAVYLPFLPLIIWFGGVLTWVICVLEGIIAAPLWMFTHMEAEGEGMGQKTAHGYLFLLNVLFRPALMCMALVAAWLMMDVFGYFLKEVLSIIYGSGAYSFSGISSIFSFLMVIGVFVMLAIFTVNKCFGLVDVLPNQVFAWVGGHYQGAGGTEAQKESHQMIMGGVQNIRSQAQMRERGNRHRNDKDTPLNELPEEKQEY